MDLSDNDYEVAFLKRFSKFRSGFVFPDIENLASVSYIDNIFLLQTTFPVAQTARQSNRKFLGLLTIYLDLTLQPRQYFVV